jgi:lipid-A-disaccharide synthase-like uncharacterized protein
VLNLFFRKLNYLQFLFFFIYIVQHCTSAIHRLDLPQVSLEWVLIGYIQFIMRSVRFKFKTDLIINWIYPIKTHSRETWPTFIYTTVCRNTQSYIIIHKCTEFHTIVHTNYFYIVKCIHRLSIARYIKNIIKSIKAIRLKRFKLVQSVKQTSIIHIKRNSSAPQT